MFISLVPTPNVIISPSDRIQSAAIGSNLTIDCTVSTVNGVESSDVEISWIGPGGGSIISDSRVTINPTTSSGNTYTSTLQITYLMEKNVGNYTCNVMILETIGSQSVELGPLTRKLRCTYIKILLYWKLSILYWLLVVVLLFTDYMQYSYSLVFLGPMWIWLTI